MMIARVLLSDHQPAVDLSESPAGEMIDTFNLERSEAADGQRVMARLSEESDAYPHVLLRIDERNRIISCRDDAQWIHQIRRGKAWRGDGYFRTRAGLMRHCGGLSLRAAKIIAALPERYIEGHPRRKGGA